MKTQPHLFFLSGIARSGSTLLGSILNQNPDIYVSPTSPLLDLYCLVEANLQDLSKQYTFNIAAKSPAIHSRLHLSFYADVDKPYIIDKHRGWPRNIATLKSIVTPNPKVIATHRPIAENVVSFLKLIDKDPNNFVDQDLKKKGMELSTINRALQIWRNYSSDPFESLQYGLKHHRECIHLVAYEDLVTSPDTVLKGIYDFLEIPAFDHSFSAIENTCAENDSLWRMKDLHTLRPSLEKTSDDPLIVLGGDLFDYFNRIDGTLGI